MINREDVHHLAELARISLAPHEEEEMQRDLEKILAYFDELKKVDTATVEPMTGGTPNENVFRADDGTRVLLKNTTSDFPECAAGFLKTPPVFE